MNQREILLLMSYISNNRDRLDYTVEQLQSSVRFRRVSVTDCTELTYAIAYRDAFYEVTNDIRLLLNLSSEDNKREYCFFCKKCKKFLIECQGFKCYDRINNCNDSCAYSKDFSVCFVAK